MLAKKSILKVRILKTTKALLVKEEKKINYQTFFAQIDPKLEQTLHTQLNHSVPDKQVREPMAYSLFAGGKRLRPLLLLSVVQTFAPVLIQQSILPAASVELIQTYSLIHDDLPAMDNDDYRRGKLANHKQFGEAQAILAGDALLTLAFEWLAQATLPAKVIVKLVNLLAHGAGADEMVAGQFADMALNVNNVTQENLQRMELKKTAALINTAVQMGAVIAQVDDINLQALNTFGTQFGLAFQIADDLADFKDGQDTREHKMTFATVLGSVEAQKLLNQTLNKAASALNQITDTDLTLIKSYFNYFRQNK